MILVYDNYKLSHSGITRFTTYEGIRRKMHHNSISNLLNYTQITGEILQTTEEKRLVRNLNSAQSMRLKRYCNKLCYYSAKRVFKSKKSGTYSMRVAFITLTAPDTTTDKQFLKAFDGFLDYLRRTANCVYVYKKELGETNGKLHVHILINNFIPYYIVSWKWKRLLLREGVKWEVNKEGKDTDAHYRIELPKNKRQIGAYIAKYLSKAFELPKECGLLWGKSAILDQCQELRFMEGELNCDELEKVGKRAKIIDSNYVTHVCIDLLTVKDIAPNLFEVFEKMYLEFSEKLTLPQKFDYC